MLELGTGTGVGTAWIASALLPRADVTVITVEKDPGTAALAAQGDWPGFVELRCADALDVLGEAGRFDLIFADAQGGKWEGLERTIAALAPHGMLIVDDMTAAPQWDTEQHARQQQVRQAAADQPAAHLRRAPPRIRGHPQHPPRLTRQRVPACGVNGSAPNPSGPLCCTTALTTIANRCMCSPTPPDILSVYSSVPGSEPEHPDLPR